MLGEHVYFLTGTDEHGMKIADTAKELGKTPIEHVDDMVRLNQALKTILNLSYDDFLRTTSDRHKRGAQKLWKELVKSGDIYKDNYSGYYCTGCEAYITEKDIVDGKCPIHKKKVNKFSEENYFFKLSKYSKKIGQLIEKDELKILPESRKNEFLNVVKDGLKDISFSRPKSALEWGIPVPDDFTQVMYVWCDALSNYITALDYENSGELFEKFWPCNVHLIGKDILRFHAGIWIGMLLSANLPLPKSIYVHGFITSGGHKMSKSLNNVISPFDVYEKYGTEALRYYLLREIPTTDDGDFTYERFEELFNGELANNLGNLVNRVLSMTERYFKGKVPKTDAQDEDIIKKTEYLWEIYHKSFNNFELKKITEEIMAYAKTANLYIDDKKPWVLAKENMAELGNVLYNLLEMIRHIGYALYPFVPETSEKILVALSQKIFTDNFKKVENWGALISESKIEMCKPLFPRIEKKA
jgi:methionyl-tRNA synthetase